MRYEQRCVCVCATVSRARRIEKLADRCACIKLYTPGLFVFLEINGAKNQNVREIRPRREAERGRSLIRRRSQSQPPEVFYLASRPNDGYTRAVKS